MVAEAQKLVAEHLNEQITFGALRKSSVFLSTTRKACRMSRFAVALWSLLGVVALAAGPPQFHDYPVTKIFRGTPAPPVLSSRNARRFRTQLRNSVQEGPN